MKYQFAKELGEDCGLEDSSEFIGNVIIHSPSLFYWPNIHKEIVELLLDARDNYGVDITEFEDELEGELK
jgi:hypothetical protein